MIGYVDEHGLTFAYAFLISQMGRIHLNFSEVQADRAGRKYVAAGEEVEFDIAIKNGKEEAVNVIVKSPRVRVNRETYRETGKVIKADKDWVRIVRPFYTEGQAYFWQPKHTLKVDDLVEYGVRPPQPPHKAWSAVNVLKVAA